MPLVGRCDSFVAETNVHHPTDFNLPRDSVRCLLRETVRHSGDCSGRSQALRSAWLPRGYFLSDMDPLLQVSGSFFGRLLSGKLWAVQ